MGPFEIGSFEIGSVEIGSFEVTGDLEQHYA
jgi:hypothetical protein